MKRSNIVFAITFIVPLVISFLIYKHFRLVLTLPLIIVGIALLLSQRWPKNEALRLLTLNFGILLSLVGVIFSALNLTTFFGVKEPIVKSEGDYGNNSRMLKYDDAMGLGYAYPANLKNYTSKKVAYHLHSPKEVIYDVIYNTDQRSNRYTPHDSKNMLNKSDSILFLGDSLTFGEGLNDNETLSYFIQAHTGRSTLNAGLHGYGAHHALRILEDEDLFRKRTRDHKIKTIIYRPIVSHINRTAGYSPWDRVGPCYELTGSGTVSYKGSFVKCGKRDNGFQAKILRRLASTSEPFTNKLFKKFTTQRRHLSRNYLPEDVDRFVAVVLKMNSIAELNEISFFVLLEDAGRYDELCGQKVPFASELEGKLKQQRLNLILTSKVYTNAVCAYNKLAISKYDKHPTMIANKLLADYIVKNNLIE